MYAIPEWQQTATMESVKRQALCSTMRYYPSPALNQQICMQICIGQSKECVKGVKYGNKKQGRCI